MAADPDGPLERYRALVGDGRLQADPAQQQALELLQLRFVQLAAHRGHWMQRLLYRKRPVRGLYLHGRVGRGKTLLMNLFAASLDDHRVPVWRIHFHRFMDHVHHRLGSLKSRRDPLKTVADRIAARARVLCFDEFHVSDIGDAMILGQLLQALFKRDVILIATSNTEPDGLYADGLQRTRFVPAIEAIKHHCQVHCLDGGEDYRLREMIRHPVFYWPDDTDAREGLAIEFAALAAGETISTEPLKVRGHRLRPLRRAGSVAWFDFATLCQGPRASSDYIELARRFGTLLLSEVPQLTDADNDATRRFIHLVDECYDRSVKLVIAAAVPPEQLYTGQRLAAPFERTRSRLIEMQSHDYLGLPHRP